MASLSVRSGAEGGDREAVPAEDAPARRPGAGVGWLTALFAAEVLALSAFDLPGALRFEYVAFEDLGGTLVVQQLLDEGLRPAVDFYYPYGLLPLLVGRAWFGLVGRAPTASYAAIVGCNLLVAWALARFAAAVRVAPIGIAVLVAAMPQAFRISHLNLTHGMEAALLCHALAEHARGRRGAALALLTACAFVKPTMAYVYGFLLAAFLARDLWRRRPARPADWVRGFAPAAIVGVALGGLLVAVFGIGPVREIQVPARGGLSYKIMQYGFFHGRGGDFLRVPNVRLGYYLGTFAGFWVAVTLAVIAGGLAASWRLATTRAPAPGLPRDGGAGPGGPRDEVIACCALLHVAFVCLFFGLSWDWVSYFIIPLLGLAAMVGRGRAWTIAGALLVLMAAIGHRSWAGEHLRSWRALAPSAATAGLWAEPEVRDEWARVVERTRGRGPLLVKLSGCGEMLFDGFSGTGSWYLHPWLVEALAPPAEIDRVAARIEAAASVVVVRREGEEITEVPRFRNALGGCRRVLQARHFDVYFREEPPPRALP